MRRGAGGEEAKTPSVSAARVQRPPDLDAEGTARWEAYRAELDAALANDESRRALHAQAMLDRVRYGSR